MLISTENSYNLVDSSQDWVKKEEKFHFTIQSLFTCHYSLSLFTVTVHLLLFMTLFTPNFAYLRGVVPYVLGDLKSSLSSDFSSLRTSLLRERTHLTSTTTTTTLFTFVHYKPCNPTNLVTRTSSSFVIVNL